MSEPRVRMYGRSDCHLCVEARSVIARVCADLGEDFAEIDIETDPELVREFNDEIPVTFVDGRRHDFWRVSEHRLRAALGGDPRGGGKNHMC